MMSADMFGRYKTEVGERMKRRDRVRKKVKLEKHSRVYAGYSEGIGMNTYAHGPMDFAKKLKLRFRVGDLDLPERRKRYTSSREEGEVDAQVCSCGKVLQSLTQMVGECEMYKEEWDALQEETREMKKFDMEELKYTR